MYRSLFAVFQQSAERTPDKAALIYKKREYSYRDLMDAAVRVAAQLQRFGVRRGERVVLCCGNTPETAAAFWGVLAAGACVAVISPDQGAAKIRFILEDSDARALVVEQRQYAELADGLATLPLLQGVVLVEPSGPAPELPGRQVVAFPGAADGWAPPGTISEDLAALIYTSGSTGQPKGVTLTHANMLCALASLNEYLGNRHDDVFLNVLPLSFDYGLYQMIMAFSVGATLVLERDMVLPLQIMKDIERYRCTVVPGVPVFFELLDQFRQLGAFDLSSVRYVSNTGAALLPRHIGIARRLFPQAQVFSMYGLTECKRCTYLPPHRIDEKPQSVGIAIPNTEIMVVDDNDQPCPPFQVGQLLVRGGTVMQGYWKRPEETARKIRQHPVYGGRCLYTGDYGYLDEEGYFYFKGRMDEVIKVRGRKLIPREIEDALRGIAGVREAAVICAELADGDYQVAAFVEGDPAALDEALLLAGCRRTLENFQIPHMFTVLPRLPRNQNGKIDKPELKRQHMQPVAAAWAGERGQ